MFTLIRIRWYADIRRLRTADFNKTFSDEISLNNLRWKEVFIFTQDSTL